MAKMKSLVKVIHMNIGLAKEAANELLQPEDRRRVAETNAEERLQGSSVTSEATQGPRPLLTEWRGLRQRGQGV